MRPKEQMRPKDQHAVEDDFLVTATLVLNIHDCLVHAYVTPL